MQAAPGSTDDRPKKAGILKKKSASMSGVWQTRWHAAESSGRFCWWKEEVKNKLENDPSVSHPPRGFVMLRDCTLFSQVKSKKFSLQASKHELPKTYSWKASSIEERDEWIAVLIALGARVKNSKSPDPTSTPPATASTILIIPPLEPYSTPPLSPTRNVLPRFHPSFRRPDTVYETTPLPSLSPPKSSHTEGEEMPPKTRQKKGSLIEQFHYSKKPLPQPKQRSHDVSLSAEELPTCRNPTNSPTLPNASDTDPQPPRIRGLAPMRLHKDTEQLHRQRSKSEDPKKFDSSRDEQIIVTKKRSPTILASFRTPQQEKKHSNGNDGMNNFEWDHNYGHK